jgi:hypothetical protein
MTLPPMPKNRRHRQPEKTALLLPPPDGHRVGEMEILTEEEYERAKTDWRFLASLPQEKLLRWQARAKASLPPPSFLAKTPDPQALRAEYEELCTLRPIAKDFKRAYPTETDWLAVRNELERIVYVCQLPPSLCPGYGRFDWVSAIKIGNDAKLFHSLVKEEFSEVLSRCDVLREAVEKIVKTKRNWFERWLNGDGLLEEAEKRAEFEKLTGQKHWTEREGNGRRRDDFPWVSAGIVAASVISLSDKE